MVSEKMREDIEILELDDIHARFILRGTNTAFANALRRIMIAEVPCMAIDEIIVYENSSILHDEILAHRLSLIPLKTDLEAYKLPSECTCKSEMGCQKCRAILKLKVEAKEEPITVYSRDLIPEDPKIAPVSPDIPIVKLIPGQAIDLEAYARLGIGKEHAKWQPVTVCAYKYMPKIIIDMDRCNLCGNCVKFCHKRILCIEEGKLIVKDEMTCDLCEECVKYCPLHPKAIKISYDKSSFIFRVESSGALPVHEIVYRAFKILSEKASHLMSSIA